MVAKAKTSYKITNWRKYNESLVRRGDVTLWFGGERDRRLGARQCDVEGRSAVYL